MADATQRCPQHLADLPMSDDRSAGWRMLHEAGKVIEMADGIVLTHSDVVEHALKQPSQFSSALAFEILGSPLPLIPAASDPNDHSRYRRMLDPFFAPRRLSPQEPALRAQINEIIDGFIEAGECEVISQLAIPYPAQVFLTLFGLPLEDRDQLIGWKDAVIDLASFSGEAPEGAALQPALELYQYLASYVTARRHGDGDDLLTRLLALADEGGLSDEEMIGLGFFFVLAGLDTVTSALGFLFHQLATRPDLRRRVIDDPSLVPVAIEEILRVEPPVPFLPRVTTEDVECGGRTIPAGARVWLMVGSANRDPAEHADPNTVDFDRTGGRHFAFGGGIHRCLGSHLARLELRLVLEEFHRRIPDYGLSPGASPRVRWPAGTFRLDDVPLVFTAGTRALGSKVPIWGE